MLQAYGLALFVISCDDIGRDALASKAPETMENNRRFTYNCEPEIFHLEI